MNTSLPQQVSAPAIADDMLLRMWLHGKQPNTACAYEADVRLFLAFTGAPLTETTLVHLQGFDASLSSAAASTRARRISAVRSVLNFATRYGAMPANPGAMLKVSKPRSTLAERILSEAEVARMIGAESDPRLRSLLRLLYVCGLRASEACDLRWRDLSGTDRKGGEARVLGKGGKLRKVGLPAWLWRELAALTPAIRPESFVLPGRDGGQLDRRAVHRAVKRAAKRARVNGAASPHWLRHSHASHALDNGASLATVRDGLGHASATTTSVYLHAKAGESSSSFIKG